VAVLATLALHPNIIRCVGCLTYSPEVCHGLGAWARAVLRRTPEDPLCCPTNGCACIMSLSCLPRDFA
jgi:hypothetical protein